MATIMITTGANGRTILMIGLEPENLSRIQDGEPFINRGLPEYGFPLSGVDLLIFEGTPEEIQAQIESEGIGVERVIDPRKEG